MASAPCTNAQQQQVFYKPCFLHQLQLLFLQQQVENPTLELQSD